MFYVFFFLSAGVLMSSDMTWPILIHFSFPFPIPLCGMTVSIVLGGVALILGGQEHFTTLPLVQKLHLIVVGHKTWASAEHLSKCASLKKVGFTVLSLEYSWKDNCVLLERNYYPILKILARRNVFTLSLNWISIGIMESLLIMIMCSQTLMFKHWVSFIQ